MDVKKLSAIYQVAHKRRIRELTIETKSSKIQMVLNPQPKWATGARNPVFSDAKASSLGKSHASQQGESPPKLSAGHNGENTQNGQNGQNEQLDKFDIISSQIGFFSRYNAKTKRQYVKLRDQVKKGEVVACIKSMHLIYEIEAEQAGKIVDFLVEEGQPVEYHQPLIRLIRA